MRITDTCPCGAAFSIDYPESRNLSSAEHHVGWLGFHAVCRERGPIPPQPELPTPTTDYPGDAGVLDTMLHIGFRHQGDDE